MQKSKIDWCDMTWNPVVGCRRNCSYCYAKRMNTRFKWIPEWTEPQFFENRLLEPSKVKKPSTIFVGSVSDIAFWKKEWTEAVLTICQGCSQHTFMFLTKDPTIYEGYKFPDNCMLGVTLTDRRLINFSIERFYDIPCKQKFISIEPILSTFTYMKFRNIDLIIVGAMTGAGAKPPKKEWIDSIQHSNIHWKANIKKYLSR